MCGIAGLIGPLARQDVLDPMLQAIVHRGPDDAGTFLGAGAALGMRRLSIIDLSGGHQPMLSRDGRYAIVLNGEIYNYLELAEALRQRGLALQTQSDTEVVLRLFEADAEACLRDLRGMFAFAIWDNLAQRLFLARDRLGKKPLYYGWVGQTFVFGSELKSFRDLPGVDLSLDPVALDDYFAYRYVPGPRTIFRSFQKLPPGHWLGLEDGQVALHQYWQADFQERIRPGLEEAEARFVHLLDESVALRLRSDVPVGVFLSGGLDSSVVVALMATHARQPVQTFSIGWRGHDSINELADARVVARHCGTDHHEVLVEPRIPDLMAEIVWHLDEPLADPAALPTLVMSQVASRSVKVVLSGEGADELFGGYGYLRSLQWLQHVPPRPAPLQALGRLIAQLVPRRGVLRPISRAAELLSGDLSEALRQTLSVFRDHERQRLLASLDLPARGAVAHSRTLNELLGELSRSWLPEELLMKVDKMTMAASLEARAPYLDHCLFELVASLPSEYKVNGRTSKLLLRRAARRWLPPEVVARQKRGFGVPISAWLSGELRPLLLETLHPKRVAAQGLLNPAVVERVLKEHERGEAAALQLWTVFCFQLWHDRFLEQAF